MIIKNTFNKEMPSLSYENFIQKYPLGEIISNGNTYGKVYNSGQYIVKVQKISPTAFREISILTRYKHPNILGLKDVSFTETEVYFSQNKGDDLKFYKSFDLTIYDVITDITAGLNFLNLNGISHCDLKAHNCIIYNSKVCLIDFGLAKFNRHYDDGQYITGLAYTEAFRDPEYFKSDINSCKVESYSIVATIFYLLREEYPSGIDRTFYFNPSFFKVRGLNDVTIDFLMACQKDLSERLLIHELIQHPAILKNRLSENVLPERTTVQTKNIQQDLREYFEWFFIESVNYKIPLNIYFLACDILMRYAVKEHVNEIEAVVAFQIACFMFDKIFHLKNFGNYSLIEICKTYSNFYDLLEGEFYNLTIWDTIKAPNFDPYFALALSSEYDSAKTFTIKGEEEKIFDKYNLKNNISFNSFLSFPISNYEILDSFVISPSFHSKKEEKVLLVLNSWAISKNVTTEIMNTIVYYVLKYREYLEFMNILSANILYEKLYTNASYSNFILLRKLVAFTPVEISPTLNKNIFILSQDDIDNLIKGTFI